MASVHGIQAMLIAFTAAALVAAAKPPGVRASPATGSRNGLHAAAAAWLQLVINRVGAQRRQALGAVIHAMAVLP